MVCCTGDTQGQLPGAAAQSAAPAGAALRGPAPSPARVPAVAEESQGALAGAARGKQLTCASVSWCKGRRWPVEGAQPGCRPRARFTSQRAAAEGRRGWQWLAGERAARVLRQHCLASNKRAISLCRRQRQTGQDNAAERSCASSWPLGRRFSAGSQMHQMEQTFAFNISICEAGQGRRAVERLRWGHRALQDLCHRRHRQRLPPHRRRRQFTHTARMNAPPCLALRTARLQNASNLAS